jgi:hypothetical protein
MVSEPTPVDEDIERLFNAVNEPPLDYEFLEFALPITPIGVAWASAQEPATPPPDSPDFEFSLDSGRAFEFLIGEEKPVLVVFADRTEQIFP